MGDLWSLVNFVGAFSNAQNDTKVLLKRIGAWDQFGTGWGDNGDEEIFGATKSRHATNSTALFSDYFTRSLEDGRSMFEVVLVVNNTIAANMPVERGVQGEEKE